jgi:hypothetical protein
MCPTTDEGTSLLLCLSCGLDTPFTCNTYLECLDIMCVGDPTSIGQWTQLSVASCEMLSSILSKRRKAKVEPKYTWVKVES